MLSIQVIGDRIVSFFLEFIVWGGRWVNRIIKYKCYEGQMQDT